MTDPLRILFAAAALLASFAAPAQAPWPDQIGRAHV